MAASFDLRERDGTLLADIAGVCFDKKISRRLNRPAQVSFRVPADSDLIWTPAGDGLPYLCAGYRQLMVTLDGPGLYFNGIVWSLQDEGDEDMVYTRVTVMDPSVIWRYRPARDSDGDLSDPTFIKDYETGPQILQAILDASENAGAGPPHDAEGDLFVDFTTGTWEGSGVDLSGAPTNWPMTIAEIATTLTNTGQLDIVIVPTNNGWEMGQVNAYNGDYGTDRTATVHFDYATGDFNARDVRRTEDMTTICNKLWMYLGPRLDLQHWRNLITSNAPNLPGNLSSGVPGIGGALPTQSEYLAPGLLGNYTEDARDALGVFMEIQIHDDQGSENSVKPLYWRLWQMEQLWRATPRNMVYVTPVRDGEFGPGDFDVGDLISINVGSAARKSVTNQVQRIYGFDIDIDDDGVEALGEFQCSPDMDTL